MNLNLLKNDLVRNLKSLDISFAIFDVCETLVTTTTIYSYFKFLMKNVYKHDLKRQFLFNFTRSIIRLKLSKGNMDKNLLLKLIKNVHKDDLEIISTKYLNEVLLKILCRNITSE